MAQTEEKEWMKTIFWTSKTLGKIFLKWTCWPVKLAFGKGAGKKGSKGKLHSNLSISNRYVSLRDHC